MHERCQVWEYVDDLRDVENKEAAAYHVGLGSALEVTGPSGTGIVDACRRGLQHFSKVGGAV